MAMKMDDKNIMMTTVFQKTGWVCPKCGRVYSPKVYECLYCNDKIYNHKYEITC